MSYKQLTQEQRYQIYTCLRIGIKQTEIARILEVDKSTINREIGQNKGKQRYHLSNCIILSSPKKRILCYNN